jgi:hypothetical protein
LKWETTRGGLLFIGSKLLEAVLETRTAADYFGTYQKQFSFETAADEGIIISSSRLAPLLIS